MSRRQEIMARARAARDKAAAYGEDLDLGAYRVPASDEPGSLNPGALALEDRERLLATGVELEGADRAGTFLQVNHSVLRCGAAQEGIEVLGTFEALEKYPWAEDYWWRIVAPDQDKYTAQVALAEHRNGYFIRALPGSSTIYPLQACLYLQEEGAVQNVHNIVIVEEGAELHLISGCASASRVRHGLHIGVSEFYVKKGARLTFTMIHYWGEEVAVRPRSATLVEEGGLFVSNYVCLRPVGSLQMYPTAWLKGPEAVARYYSILVAPPGTSMDLGSRVVLQAPRSRAEVVARTLTTGGEIINRGCLVAEAQEVKAHLECRGLVLGEKGVIDAIPELLTKVGNVDLSHEAAVGKIAQEEIEYLMARGLSEEEATATIVRGFLNVQIVGLPAALQAEIDRAVAAGEKALL
ncbi:MAG: SufD family Fe-S cluster assembly protein [Clostridia bacterium]|nr:SufD family Fe-S cluster assembly protein [Clostridia bacterium]MDH7573230.1 SufD family Fe-S cluster assembly protein [Clostridia bacterium]